MYKFAHNVYALVAWQIKILSAHIPNLNLSLQHSVCIYYKWMKLYTATSKDFMGHNSITAAHNKESNTFHKAIEYPFIFVVNSILSNQCLINMSEFVEVAGISKPIRV